ncbi:glycosyl hydrolase [uncultured Bacteroides sp.]|uniref:glycosyl hydrolase n=1 Tax=uncultured Bacteroides sp. TaxID=162156 RepID=UPI002AAAA29D|nr:glycosyl hydrolase [uncultured Bacteroides sp.]
MSKYKIALLSLLFLCCTNSGAQKSLLAQRFNNPTVEAAPWVFWYWMHGVVSKAGITADMEAMKEAGLGGAYLMPIKGVIDDKSLSPAYQQLTPEWWEMVRFSMQEADRVGLKLGMHICDGFALAGGPWITPEKSMQKVVWSDTIISGGKIKNLRLPRPSSYEGFYKEIGLYAVPVLDECSTNINVPVVTSSNVEDKTPSYLVNKKEEGGFKSYSACWVQYTFKEPFTCRSIEIVLGGNNYQAHRLKVCVSDDGVHFRTVKQLTPARQGWQNTDENSTHIIPATKARYFRFYWDPKGSEPGSEDMDAAKWKPTLRIKKLFLSSKALIGQFEGKTGLVWRVSKRTQADELLDKDCVKMNQVIDLSSSLKDDVLNAVLPAGKWKIVRMGHTSTGHTNATGGGGQGLECDKFSEEAVNIQFDHWFGEAFRKTNPELAKRVLKFMHVDSWECGSQNWSDNFISEFKKRRGYDLTPYLLVYTGTPLESAEKTESVLSDIRQTISELIVDVFYKTLAVKAKEYDCEFSAESVAPTMVSDGMLHYQAVDRPMGEFWLNSPTHDKPNDMLDAISGAHIYGKNIIQAEGFTQLRTMWNENPVMLKPLLDRNYALGINKLFYHVFVHNPYVDKAPGMTLDGIGLFFQRDQTWWKQGKAWVDYARRCQTMLQFGHPVIDVAVFTGEETPRRAILPDRLLSSLPGIFGKERVEAEAKRLANEGQPVKEMPVGVSHSANMTDLGDWVDPLRGYAYDSFNKDALVRLSRAEHGRLVVSGGAAYRILVLPKPHPMSPDSSYMSLEVARKIKMLQKSGVVVLLGDKPSLVPGLSDKDYNTKELNKLAGDIWSASAQYKLPYEEPDFTQFGLKKDVIFMDNAKDFAWTHREGDGVDIYFIANQKNEARQVTVSLRCDGRQPELWNPVTGEQSDATVWNESEGRTTLSLDLAANQSVFVVFQRQTTSTFSEKKQTLVFGSLQVKEWTVNFPDVSKSLRREHLFDWSKEEDADIKYYSGTANYESSFQWKKKVGKKQIYLDLGKVNVMAEVIVNGINCGTVWTAPYRVNITSAIKKGNNKLEIQVVNTWMNKMKGVHDQKIKAGNVWTNATYWSEKLPLQESGLTGPLNLVY